MNQEHYHQQQQNEKSAKVFNNQWVLKKKVSSGSFGVVFIGQDKITKELVAIKLEKEDNDEVKSLDREVQIFNKLQGVQQIPRLYWSGIESNYNVMVLSLLGRDLAHFMKVHKKLSIKTVLMLIDQLIPILENVHNRSVIHRDLKPENILMGRDSESHCVFLIDFGISKIYRDSQGRHIPFKERKPFIGTTRYASIAAHQGHELGRKDDLESLGYVMIFLIKGQLPWQNLQNVSDRDKTEVVGELKVKTSTQDLCKDLPIEFAKYLDYVKKLNFKTTPDYKYLKNLFVKLGQQLNIKYMTNDFDWNNVEKDMQARSGLDNSKMGLQMPSGFLIPPEKNRKNNRNPSATPSQRSITSSRGSFMTVMSQNSVYIKYQPQASMYKPNSSMNFDEDYFNMKKQSIQYIQEAQKGMSQSQNQIQNHHLMKKHEIIKEESKQNEDGPSQISSLYCNVEMEEWNNASLDNKIKNLQRGGVKACFFIKNKHIKSSPPSIKMQ